jgi:nucleotide-binding universal stress UspA family protein
MKRRDKPEVTSTGTARGIERTPNSIKSILIPTDFSAYSEKALEYALPLAGQFGAQLTLLHVVEPTVPLDDEGRYPAALELKRVREFCESALRALAEKFKIAPEQLGGLVVRCGKPFNEIALAAEELKTDLIIIATHGHTGLKHTLLGSTAERVLRHSPCPVLVVR